MKWFVLLVGLMVMGCYDYSVDSNDVTCDAEEGECIVCTDSDCSSTVSIVIPESSFRDKCDGSFKANMLLGTCWVERCVNGEKTLLPKTAGVNCVHVPDDAPNDEFVIGVCDEYGTCN